MTDKNELSETTDLQDFETDTNTTAPLDYDFNLDRTTVKVKFTDVKFFDGEKDIVDSMSIIGKMRKKQAVKYVKDEYGRDSLVINISYRTVTFDVPTADLYRLQGA